MGGWNKTWPSGFKDKLKGLGLKDADITNLMNSKSLADTKKLADPLIKKNEAKAKAIKDALNQAMPGLNLH